MTDSIIIAEISQQAAKRKQQRKAAELAKAKQRIASAVQLATAQAAEVGINIRASKFHVYERRSDGASRWPLTLAELLYRDRSLCKLSNAKLGVLVANKLNLDRPITASAMTNPLQKGQIKKVAAFLAQLGIGGEFKNATGIKNLLHAGPRNTRVAVQVSGHVSTDGERLTIGAESYPIKDRNSPTKRANVLPLWDKQVLILDHKTPLPVVLKLLGVLDKFGEEQFAAGVAHAQAQAAAKTAIARDVALADDLELSADAPYRS